MFGSELPFFDQRVASALAIQMQLQIAGFAVGTSARVQPADERNLPWRTSRDQVPLLLAAAGFPSPVPWTEVGRCRIWVAPPPVDVIPSIAPAQAAEWVAFALRETLDGLGVRTRPCEPTTSIDQAHLLVWVEGGPPPALPTGVSPPTFLSWPGLGFVPPRGAPPAAPRVSPPGTGSAGLASHTAGAGAAELLLAGCLAIAARAVIRRA